MGKGRLPAAERLVDRVNRLVRAGLDNINDREMPPAPPRTADEALFLVRDRLGKLIVERRNLQRRIDGVPEAASDLATKAELAVREGREDLARAAFDEAARLGLGRDGLMDALGAINADIALLEEAASRLAGPEPWDRRTHALLAELDRLVRDAGNPGSKP